MIVSLVNGIQLDGKIQPQILQCGTQNQTRTASCVCGSSNTPALNDSQCGTAPQLTRTFEKTAQNVCSLGQQCLNNICQSCSWNEGIWGAWTPASSSMRNSIQNKRCRLFLRSQTLYVQEINQTHQKVNKQETTDNA